MSNPLLEAINAERAARSGNPDATPARKPADSSGIDPARVAALAAELIAKRIHASDSKHVATCPNCGTKFSTSPTTKETGNDDNEENPAQPFLKDDSEAVNLLSNAIRNARRR